MTRKECTRRRRRANRLAREHMHTIVAPGPRRAGMLMAMRRNLRRVLGVDG